MRLHHSEQSQSLDQGPSHLTPSAPFLPITHPPSLASKVPKQAPKSYLRAFALVVIRFFPRWPLAFSGIPVSECLLSGAPLTILNSLSWGSRIAALTLSFPLHFAKYSPTRLTPHVSSPALLARNGSSRWTEDFNFVCLGVWGHTQHCSGLLWAL